MAYTVSYTFAPGSAIYAVNTEKFWVKPGQVDGVEIDIFENQMNITYWVKFNNAQGSRAVDERQAFQTAQGAFNYISNFFAGVTQTPAITPTLTPTNSITPQPSFTPSISPTFSITPSLTETVTPTISETAAITPTPTSSVTPSNTATVTPTVTLSSSPRPLTYADIVKADNPYAYYQLNDTSGTTAVDSSGNSYNSTYTGTYTLNAPSIMPHGSGASLELSGAGYVSLFPILALLTYPLTIECWIKTPSPNSHMELVDVGGYGSPNLYIDPSQTLTFGYVDLMTSASSTNILNANTIYHCVVTVNSSGNITFYTNGVVNGTGTTSGNAGTGTGTIGAYSYNTAEYLYTGYIQNVAIYNYALSATQVLNHYNAG